MADSSLNDPLNLTNINFVVYDCYSLIFNTLFLQFFLIENTYHPKIRKISLIDFIRNFYKLYYARHINENKLFAQKNSIFNL